MTKWLAILLCLLCFVPSLALDSRIKSFYVWPDQGNYIRNGTGKTGNNYGNCIVGTGDSARERLLMGYRTDGALIYKAWLKATAFNDSCANHSEALDSVILWVWTEPDGWAAECSVKFVPTALDTNKNPNEGALCDQGCAGLGEEIEMTWLSPICGTAWATAGASGAADTGGVFSTDTVLIMPALYPFGEPIRFRIDTSWANKWKSADYKNEGVLLAPSWHHSLDTVQLQYITIVGPASTGEVYNPVLPVFQCFYTESYEGAGQGVADSIKLGGSGTAAIDTIEVQSAFVTSAAGATNYGRVIGGTNVVVDIFGYSGEDYYSPVFKFPKFYDTLQSRSLTVDSVALTVFTLNEYISTGGHVDGGVALILRNPWVAGKKNSGGATTGEVTSADYYYNTGHWGATGAAGSGDTLYMSTTDVVTFADAEAVGTKHRIVIPSSIYNAWNVSGYGDSLGCKLCYRSSSGTTPHVRIVAEETTSASRVAYRPYLMIYFTTAAGPATRRHPGVMTSIAGSVKRTTADTTNLERGTGP